MTDTIDLSKLSKEDLEEREKMLKNLKPKTFVVTSSGTLIDLPTTPEEWKEFNECDRFVDGVDKVMPRF